MFAILRVLPLVLVAGTFGFTIGRVVRPGGRVVAMAATEPGKVREEALKAPISESRSLPGMVDAGVVGAGNTSHKAAESDQLADDLRAAYRAGDALGSAKKAFAVISKLSRADFQKWALDPEAFPSPTGLGADDVELQEAIAAALVERWLTVDPEGGLASMAKVEQAQLDAHLVSGGELFKALAHFKPELRLQLLAEKRRVEPIDRSLPSLPVAFRSLAGKDPAAARAYLDQLSDSDQRKAAETAIAQGIADHDPVAGVRLAQELKDRGVFMAALSAAEKAGEARLREALISSDGSIGLGNEVSEYVLRHPNLDWENLLKAETESSPGATSPSIGLAEQLSPEECVRRLGQTNRLPDQVRATIDPLLVKSWAAADPKAAAEWACTRANAPDASAGADDSLTVSMVAWMRADKPSALAWFAQLPDSAAQQKLGNAIAVQFALKDDPQGALAFFHSDAASPSEVASIAKAVSDKNPAAAGQLIATLPAEVDATASLGPLLHSWLSSDPAAAADWVEALPPGKRRESATQAYIQEAAQLDPAVAAASCEYVSDPKTRQKLAENIYQAMAQRSPGTARAWIQSLAGMDAAWKDRVIRLLR